MLYKQIIIIIFILRPSRVQSSPWTRTNSSTETTQPPRPVTAGALPTQTAPIPEERPATQQPPASSGGADNIQLSDLQSILSGMTTGQCEQLTYHGVTVWDCHSLRL